MKILGIDPGSRITGFGLIQIEGKPLDTEVTQNPSTTTELSGDQAIKFTKMIDLLEELDDVQNVYTNGDIN